MAAHRKAGAITTLKSKEHKNVLRYVLITVVMILHCDRDRLDIPLYWLSGNKHRDRISPFYSDDRTIDARIRLWNRSIRHCNLRV